MSEAATAVDVGTSEDARLESLGYKPQLNRVLGFFSNFAVGFTYLSPMVGIYSLFVFGFGIAGPAYIWLTFIPLIGMLFVALVFGELASHYPVAGALFQYSKFSVGPRFGWFVGWFYGFALLITVAPSTPASSATSLRCCTTGSALGWNLNPAGHGTILVHHAHPARDPVDGEHHRRPDHGATSRSSAFTSRSSARSGSRSSSAIHGFHHGFGFLFSTQGAQHAATNAFGLNFHGSWLAAALVAVLAPVYIFYGFESCGRHRRGDEGRRPPDPEGDAPRADLGRDRVAHPHGAVCCSRRPKHDPVGSTVAGGIPSILAQLPSGLQDFLLLVIIFAFFSCGSSIQGAGSRLAFSYARDGALPGSGWLSRVNQRFKTPVNALLMGAVITVLFCLLVYINPGSNYHIWFVTYPAHVNALVALVSFGVSGIYLSFLLTVIGAVIARARGWKPEGSFRLGKWGWPVTIVAVGYLGAMFLNVVYPSGLSSARAIFNIDWITLFVMFIIAVVGAAYLLIGRPDRNVERHLQGAAEPPETPPITAA